MAENFGSKIPRAPSPTKGFLSELSASASNARVAMPPPAANGHKRQASGLPEPPSKRKTLAERGGEPIKASIPAPRTIPSTISGIPAAPSSRLTSSSSTSSIASSGIPASRYSSTSSSHSTQSSSTSSGPGSNFSFSKSVGSGIKAPSAQTSTSSSATIARPKSSLAKTRANGAVRPATAMGARGREQDGPKNKQAWDPEEQYSNMERMYQDVCTHYKQVMADNVEAKETNNSFKATIAGLEQERRDVTEQFIILRTDLETTKYRLEASERDNQELKTRHEQQEHDLKTRHEQQEDNLKQQHSRDIQQLKVQNEEEIEGIKATHQAELDAVRETARLDLERLKSDHREELRELKRTLEEEVSSERLQRVQALTQVATQGAVEQQRHQQELAGKDHDIKMIKADNDQLKYELDKVKEELRVKNEYSIELMDTRSEMMKQLSNRMNEIEELQAKIKFLESDSKSQSQAYAAMEDKVKAAAREVAEKEQKLREGEMHRRKLHNQIQELKGNIRVFARVRPTHSDDQEETAKISYPAPEDDLEDPKEITVIGPESQSSLGKVNTKIHAFSFDRVFNPANTNAEVFEEISTLVQSALDGYNVCIFAYGQTGSGKTFTMSSEDGMIPRTLRQIYNTSTELKTRGWHYSMTGSFVEVYNEEIRDLLAPPDAPPKKHEIRHDMERGETTLTDVMTLSLDSQDQVESILSQAMSRRSVAATAANEHSSRSHSVFILKIVGVDEHTGREARGTLNLVDLAGSERLSASKVEGARLKETQNINKSLACLGDIIAALGQQNAPGQAIPRNQKETTLDGKHLPALQPNCHVPYRNSKLTHMLQFSLGGNSKTLMFVMLAPEKKSLGETITSLRFADKVARTKIGVAKRSVKS